jgi:hypothetical protein
MTPHKHAALIKAWADGETIQLRVVVHDGSGVHYDWRDIVAPCWKDDLTYRVKPEKKSPGEVLYYLWSGNLSGIHDWDREDVHLKGWMSKIAEDFLLAMKEQGG